MKLAFARTLLMSPLLAALMVASPRTGLAAAAAAAAAAASSATTGLEEVVVTATRREERLQDVPISISAFSQEKLDAQGLHNIDDLTRLTPGVTFTRNGMSSSANYNDENSDINFRGIDSTAGTSTTGIYIDDTPVQSRHLGFAATNVYPALFDLDRVEALRGPQGTLFGAGAEGGAVRFLTAQPGLSKASGYLRSELATTHSGDPSYEVGAAAGGPIIDNTLGFRVSASYRRDGGWVDKVAWAQVNPADPATALTFLGNLESRSNWQDVTTFRAALKWAASDSVSVTPSIYYQKLRINDTAAYWPKLSDPAGGVYRNGNALTNPATDPFWLAAVKVEWATSIGQLTSNTSYYSRSQHSTSDYTQYLRATFTASPYPAPGDIGYALFRDEQENYYQEIRLASKDAGARISWNTGLFYAHMKENIPEDIIDPTLDAEAGGYCALVGVPCPNGLWYHQPLTRVIDTQTAVFGEASLRFTDTLKLTLGLRLANVSYRSSLNYGGAFVGGALFTSEASASEKPVTPKVVLAWQPDRDNLVYVSAAKGYRVGGANGDVGNICDTPYGNGAGDLTRLGLPIGPDGKRHVPGQYNSDSLWSYELGAKNTLLDHRLQINSSFFYIDWSNIQQSVYLLSCGEQLFLNLGHARSVGGDVDIIYKPVDTLKLELTAAYVSAKFTRTSCAGLLTFNGSQCSSSDGSILASPIASKDDVLPGAPWNFTAAAEWTFAPVSGRAPYLRIDYSYSTAQSGLLPIQNVNDASSDGTLPGLPSTSNLALRGGVRFGGFDVSLFAQNLTDEHPVLFKSRDVPTDADQLYFERGVRPRTIGITAAYRY
jgi:outer membrane receptor protein involved in Fe transport